MSQGVPHTGLELPSGMPGISQSLVTIVPGNAVAKDIPAGDKGATTSSQLGVQFIGLGYYYPSIEKIDRSTQFGAIGYIITLFVKKLRENLGVRLHF